MDMTNTCMACQRPFSPKPGTTGRYCSQLCYYAGGPGRHSTPRLQAVCETCGATFTPKPSSAGKYCSHACYGTAALGKPKKANVERRMRLAPNHPIAPPGGILAVARMVLYEKIGPGTHPCNWCGRTLRWTTERSPDSLFADHLDHDPTNDTAANLVASCNRCNKHRTHNGTGKLIGADEPVVMMSNGPTRAVARNCETCGAEFLAVPALVRRGKARFCSRSCARRQPRVK